MLVIAVGFILFLLELVLGSYCYRLFVSARKATRTGAGAPAEADRQSSSGGTRDADAAELRHGASCILARENALAARGEGSGVCTKGGEAPRRSTRPTGATTEHISPRAAWAQSDLGRRSQQPRFRSLNLKLRVPRSC